MLELAQVERRGTGGRLWHRDLQAGEPLVCVRDGDVLVAGAVLGARLSAVQDLVDGGATDRRLLRDRGGAEFFEDWEVKLVPGVGAVTVVVAVLDGVGDLAGEPFGEFVAFLAGELGRRWGAADGTAREQAGGVAAGRAAVRCTGLVFGSAGVLAEDLAERADDGVPALESVGEGVGVAALLGGRDSAALSVAAVVPFESRPAGRV